jgi:uncharacterized protein (TIGR02246 family)
MLSKGSFVLVSGLAAVLTIGVLPSRDDPARGQPPTAEPGRETDREAIQKSAKEFSTAFNKADATAVAALWTEQGECHDADGTVVYGRAAIEQAFRAQFQAAPKAQIEVLIETIRFPAPDLAIEEGILRQSGAGKELPTTTVYSATHIREGGRWRIAVSREWGAGQDRLEDLEWLIGEWKATLKDQEVILTFARDARKPFLTGRFTKQAGDKIIDTGTLRVGLDPQTGRLRSWHFDDNGGHGQALWVRDGHNWVLDSAGVLGDGTETGSVNILGRISNDEITWRSIDRVIGDQPLPDTVPIKLTRVHAAK